MDPVNVGVLGASSFALKHTARALNEAEGVRFAALATSSPDKAAPFQAFAPDLRVHDSYDALLADPAIEAVYLPLPNHLHVEWARKALEAGKHVLTEKPIAMRADEVDGLIALRDATGLFATEAYMIVHHPQWQLVRRLIDEGEIGALRHVDTVFSYDNSADVANIRNRPETGGGSIPDIGVYTYGSARFAARAEPVELSARIRRENGVDVWAHVTGTMAGATGEFTYSSITSMRLYPRQEVTFQGETGMIRLTAPFNAGVYRGAEVHVVHGDTERVEHFPTVRQYVLQMQAFARRVRDEAAPYPWTLEDARGTQAMIDLIFAGEV
ncbi:Gfo/Idh/MocA family oxidoreductase [Actinotalea sp. M2MS4P-6]|uniref:Gfo/Idh/MocA family protein n=1 Tax=Actinotalea sp. M2MS4P-6 TaxID=2983762 RepID=UPI0021E3DBEC|nr:Gfo/Idh/MocA family oxidoreductase [Actinotalea sp. M2MS4P-6]MCV2396010.1 Gfo/Idh/MocA family oxidoreductase [Actinotalea sp. M2MS4P-6]